jgi:hypothetical protein
MQAVVSMTTDVARFQLDIQSIPPAASSRPVGRNYRHGLWLITGLTAAWIAWLIYRFLVRPSWLENLPAFMAEMLALSEAAAVVTLAALWIGLWWRIWRQPSHRARPLSLPQLQSLSPAAFERHVAGLFRQKGYQVKVRGRSGDSGVDLEVVDQRGRRAIVQCKRYQNQVGPKIIRELYGTLMHEGVIHAFLVTSADISEAGRQWARGKPITLIDGVILADIGAEVWQEQLE